NLRSLLLQPPLRDRRVLAVDPGFRTGCKLAALDEYGGLLEHAVIYPFGGGPRKGPREKKEKPAPAQAPTPPAEPQPPVEDQAPAEPPAAEQPPAVDAAAPVEPPPLATLPEGATPPAEPQPPVEDQAPAEAAEAPAAEAPAAEAQPAAPPAPDRRAEAKGKVQEMVSRHDLSVIALGNGTGCR